MEHATNLKEMYMDDSIFWVDYVDEHDEVLDLENDVHSNIFLFHKLSSIVSFWNVSIRNAKWDFVGIRDDTTIIPQSALIKFVRNAPQSLWWFRSHLTRANMTMLRSERPGIELVNFIYYLSRLDLSSRRVRRRRSCQTS